MADKKPFDDLNHLSIDEIERRINEDEMDWLSRRDLLDKSARVIGGLSLGMLILSGSSKAYADVDWVNEGEKTKTSPKTKKVKAANINKKSCVAKMANRKAVDSSGSGKEGAVFNMITKGIRDLSGEKDSAKAWRTVASEGQRVGIKVNCIAGPNMSTQVPVVMAIIEGLKSAGVRERDIIIWERSDRELKRAGFAISTGTDSLRCHGTKSYEPVANNINGTKFKLSTILTNEIDVLINVPVMKNHGASGVTLALKNHYGSHNNPGDHHGNNCDPAIANICSHDDIHKKTKLIVLDALRAQCNGGPSDKPQFKWNPGIILMSRDSVAIDRIGGEIIDARRIETNIKPLGNSHRHIITAAGLGLGIADRNMIEVKNVVV